MVERHNVRIDRGILTLPSSNRYLIDILMMSLKYRLNLIMNRLFDGDPLGNQIQIVY